MIIRGLKALENQLDKLTALLMSNDPELERIAFRAGEIIARRAKEIITEKGHIVTGNLRASIRTVIEKPNLYQIDIYIGTDVFYSVFVEALPDGGYLFPAFREKQQEAINYIANGIVDLLRTKIR